MTTDGILLQDEAPQPTPPPRKHRRGLGERLRGNPVMLKELRGRMRGARAMIVMTVYLALMSGFMVLLYLIYASSALTTSSPSGSFIGRTLFAGVVGIELFLVAFIAPAFTAGAISGERERQTYDLLRTTLLPARSLIIGKLFSALSYVLLLLLAALPLQSMAFLFGGVEFTEIIGAFVLLMVTAISFGTVGIYFSATTKRTLTASVMTYAFAMSMTVGLPIILIVLGPILFGISPLGVNPAIETGIFYFFSLLVAINPVATAITSENLLVNERIVGFYSHTLHNGSQIPAVSPWIPYTVFYLLLSVVLIILAVRRTRRIEDV